MTRLKELALLFLKLGAIGFGGPAVHIAMMQKDVVEKKKWMTDEHFLDLVGATNLIPGPNSTEMTMHCGHERAGWKGLVIAGACFILPAAIITGTIAWAYKQYGQLPEVSPFLYGIKPAIIAVIASAMVALGKKAIKSKGLLLLGLLCLALSISGVNEFFVLFGAGLLSILIHSIWTSKNRVNSIIPIATIQVSNLKIFWIFLKIGSILYGSGYVLFAFLDSALVSKGIITHAELIDAIAVGQFTPGPVFSAATFIGWQINGFVGAVAATIGIFLPSFLFVALANPLIPKLRNNKMASVFFDAVNVASIAIIVAVSVEMGRDAIQDLKTALIAILSLAAALTFKKLNTAFVVLGGAMLGYGLYLLG